MSEQNRSNPEPQRGAAQTAQEHQPEGGGRKELRGALPLWGRRLLTGGVVLVGIVGACEALGLATAGFNNPFVESSTLPGPFAEDVQLLFGTPADKERLLAYYDTMFGDCAITAEEEYGQVRPMYQVYQDFKMGNAGRLVSYVQAHSGFSESVKSQLVTEVQRTLPGAYEDMLQDLRNEPDGNKHEYMRIDHFVELIGRDLDVNSPEYKQLLKLKDVLYQQEDLNREYPLLKTLFYPRPTRYLVMPQSYDDGCNDSLINNK